MGANAQTSVPAFTSGQILTASQVTQINTGIPVFASSTERDAAFGGVGEKTLAEGQMAYLEDTNATQVYDGSAWAAVAGGKILQVVSTPKLDVFSTTSTSLVDITGLSVTITPTSATSEILVMTQVNVGHSNIGSSSYLDLVRDSTSIFNSTYSIGGGYTLLYNGMVFDQYSSMPVNFVYLDSPATTSATTYKVQTATTTGTQYVNRNGANTYGATSSITVMEVSA